MRMREIGRKLLGRASTFLDLHAPEIRLRRQVQDDLRQVLDKEFIGPKEINFGRYSGQFEDGHLLRFSIDSEKQDASTAESQYVGVVQNGKLKTLRSLLSGGNWAKVSNPLLYEEDKVRIISSIGIKTRHGYTYTLDPKK